MDDMFLNQFRPPDDSTIEFVLNLSASLSVIRRRDTLTTDDKAILKEASHSLRVLLAMAVGGHFLFTSESRYADALADLSARLYDRLFLSGYSDMSDVDVGVLSAFRTYREEGPDVSDLPFLGDDTQ